MKKIEIEINPREIEVELEKHTSGARLIPGPKGEDGHTPTEEELLSLIQPLIKNGEDGADGHTPTEEEILEIAKPLIPKEKDIIKKISAMLPDEQNIINEVVKKIPKPKDGKVGPKGKDGEKMKFSDLTPYEKQILTGPQGSNGVGVPRGGTTGQKLIKTSSRDYHTEWTDDTGGGAIDSVNGQTGVVVLDTSDIAETTDLNYVSDAQLVVIGNTTGVNSGNVTVTDSAEIDFTLTGQNITASLIAGSIDETKLDTSVNASLDLADSAVQNLGDLGVTSSAAELNILDGATLSTTELNYVDGVTSAIQTQIDSKQATLVSGTNIKTINSTSLLGSGDITISAAPGGSNTQIQFNDGGAFGGATATWNKVTEIFTFPADGGFTSLGDLYITAPVGNFLWLAQTSGNTPLKMQGSTGFSAIFSLANIATSDKTFTFPNTTGTIALTSSSITGSAATLTTPRAIYGNNFDGSAALTQVIASTYGGTGNGFTKISGPTTTERTKTMRDANDTVLELGGSYTPTGTWTSMTLVTPALGTPASGVMTNVTGLTEAGQTLADNTTNNVSTTKHGYAPKAPNDATKYLDGTGAYSVPSAGFTSQVKAYLGSNQTISTGFGSRATLVLDTESYDTGSEFNTTTYTFTAGSTGYYQVCATLNWSSWAANTGFEFYMVIATVEKLMYNLDMNNGTGAWAFNYSQVIKLSATDTLSFKAAQYTGSNKTLTGGDYSSWVTITRVG